MYDQRAIPSMNEIDLSHQRVLIREDFNVPIDDQGNITDDTRIRRAIPTIQKALAEQATVILISHLGRPKVGEFDRKFSLEPVAKRLSALLDYPVTFVKDWQNDLPQFNCPELLLLENIRFYEGETRNDPAFVKQLASLGDVFIMDAFAVAHRAHASTVGLAKALPKIAQGLLFQEEWNNLHTMLMSTEKPFAAVVGGSKVSTKIAVLDKLLDRVDTLIVGGGIANTLLKAAGFPIGKSLHEPNWIDKAKALLEKAKQKDVKFPLPIDVVVAPAIDQPNVATVKSVADVKDTDSIFDIGPETQKMYAERLQSAKKIMWNGPVGVFEIDAFSRGTRAIAQVIADSQAETLAGGGDTIAALNKFHLFEKIGYVSTAGGAFLKYIEGGEFPIINILSGKE